VPLVVQTFAAHPLMPAFACELPPLLTKARNAKT
jgi:hypothetical protein